MKLHARVVRKVDNAIHRIHHYPVDSVVWFVLLTLIRRIVIYTVDSVIKSSNNRATSTGLYSRSSRALWDTLFEQDTALKRRLSVHPRI